MSESELWEAIRKLQAEQSAQNKRLDDFEQWLEQVALSAKMGAKVSVNTLQLIRSQLELSRGKNDNN